MNKEKLEQKISELLNVAENDSSFAFNTLKEKIVQNLKVGEAIRIKNLGVFQLKEQLREDSSIGRKTLLFSPAKSISDKDSLFLTLEIDPKNIDSIEFDEKVFQLGIDKPMINLDGKDSPKDSDNPNKIIENKITELIDESERMDNFDIWEDYLEGKETTSILDDSEKDELESFLEDDGTAENKKTVYESDFEELNEEEIFNELMDEGNLNSDELDELTSNIEKEGEIKNLIEDENIDNKNIDDVFLEDEEISETLETIEDDLEKINEKEVEDFVENNLDDIVDEKDFDLEYEGDDEVLDEVEKTKLEIEEIKDVEKIEEPENTNKELVEGAAKVEKKITEVKPKLTDESFSELPTHKIPVKKLKSKRPKPILYFLIGLFLIVAAVGIYYLLFNDPYLLKDEHDVEVALSEKHAQEFEEAKASANNENTDETIANDEAVNEVAEQVKEDPKVVDEKIQEEIAKSIPVKSVETKKESIKEAAVTSGADEIKMIESSSNESEASKNIYFDGTTYSVQVASFKSKSIAEREAQKLLKKGFPAFLVKTYIKKFDGTWHRVRIGPYSTLGEAKSNQSILN